LISYKVLASENFVKELKRLSKKYHSIKDDVANLGDDLSLNPKLGVFIGKDCYKVRLAIKSKGKSKSGRARVIT
jgi:mRNA-degrading endonuclease RelE of RelBE toxin-antitoxin system